MKTFEHHFLSLFKVIGETDYYSDALVSFKKSPMMSKVVTLSEEEAIKKGYQIEEVVTQYCYTIYINLWLVFIKLRFKSSWQTGKR